MPATCLVPLGESGRGRARARKDGLTPRPVVSLPGRPDQGPPAEPCIRQRPEGGYHGRRRAGSGEETKPPADGIDRARNANLGHPATGSVRAPAGWRKGVRMPHPMHWDMLAGLAGVPAPNGAEDPPGR